MSLAAGGWRIATRPIIAMDRCDLRTGSRCLLHRSLKREITRMGAPKHGGRANSHHLWQRWRSMMARCHSTGCSSYGNYGARGITVCERWKYFPNFCADMDSSFFIGATIERIDNNAGYSPENCRWATMAEQTRNRRATRMLDTPWGRMTLLEASRKIGIRHATLRKRLANNWPTERLYGPAQPVFGWGVTRFRRGQAPDV